VATIVDYSGPEHRAGPGTRIAWSPDPASPWRPPPDFRWWSPDDRPAHTWHVDWPTESPRCTWRLTCVVAPCVGQVSEWVLSGEDPDGTITAGLFAGRGEIPAKRAAARWITEPESRQEMLTAETVFCITEH
jgi:hypothetical protein